MALASSKAQQIVDYLLSSSNEILAMSIMDMSGNILAAKSKDSFKQEFEVTQDGDRYGGTLAVVSLSLANEVKDVLGGEAQAIIAIYKNCKMMLLPLLAYHILLDLYLSAQSMQKIIRLLMRLKDWW
jgi:hypothetical protein